MCMAVTHINDDNALSMCFQISVTSCRQSTPVQVSQIQIVISMKKTTTFRTAFNSGLDLQRNHIKLLGNPKLLTDAVVTFIHEAG